MDVFKYKNCLSGLRAANALSRQQANSLVFSIQIKQGLYAISKHMTQWKLSANKDSPLLSAETRSRF